MFRKILFNENGSAITLVALGMTVLLGLVSLVTDVGLIFVSKFDLVNALDAAALAGAQELPERPDLAVAVAQNYAIANGVNENDLNIEVFNGNRSIKVNAGRNVNLLFAKVIGFNNGAVNHDAIAEIAPVSATKGIAPLAVRDQDLVFGEQYTLKVGAQESSTGWFCPLALGGAGADIYEDNLTYDYQSTLKIGDVVDIQTGNISNPTKRAIDSRIAECQHSPYCTAGNFELDCNRLLTIPIIEKVDTKTVRVTGFAMLLVDEVSGQGIDCYVKGWFVKTIEPGEISEVNEAAVDAGFYGVRLIK